MSRGSRSGRGVAALLLLALLAALTLAAAAGGERSQRGDLIIALRGELSPLQLDRHDPQPVDLQLAGGLESADGSLLPRVDRVEIGFPSKGIVATRGLPVCRIRQLRNATSEGALAACRPALVGHGAVEAAVQLPDQGAFLVHARLLVFNGPIKQGHRLLILHGYALRPPTTVVLPFTLQRRRGRFGIVIGADLPAALGPWPHLARFEMSLGRRYAYKGRERSFLSATCPIPPRFTAGFFSLSQSTYTLSDGRRVSRTITRSCRGG
jgi:hypothetical protein